MNKTTRLQLKRQAHPLKPVVIVGSHGLTEAVQKEINVALTAHELIKIRLNSDSKETRLSMAQAICQAQGAELIRKIGHTVIVYRRTEHNAC